MMFAITYYKSSKTYIISLFCLFITAINLNAQEPKLSWVKQIGSLSNDYGADITVDSSGNVYTTGAFNNTADFDPGLGTYNLTSVGYVDIFVHKLDASGKFVWAKQMGGANLDYGTSIALDVSGNVYSTGVFEDTVDFDPGSGTFNLISAGNHDIFVQKLNASGNFVWAKKMGEKDVDQGYSVAVDATGNVYTTGHFRNTVDFDPGSGIFNLTSAGRSDIFIQKLNAAGNFVWTKKMGGPKWEYGYSIAIDASGYLYTTGYFSGTVDFDPGTGIFNLTSSGGHEIFIQKLDASGNFVWAKQMGGNNSDRGSSIALDTSGNVYTTGSFSNTADFDPGLGTFNLTSAGWGDIFIHKLDAVGNFIWVKRLGGKDIDQGNSIAIDALGNVYTTGNFKGTLDFDPGPGTFNLTSAGNSDIFVQKLDSSGMFIWAIRLGGLESIHSYAIAIDALNNLYITGGFYGIADFDPAVGTFNLTSSGYSDIFIAKYSDKFPYITKHPFSRTKCTGESITFDVIAGGAGVIGYQWRKNGIIIPGATNSFFMIDSVSLGDSGNYCCFVFNASDTLESDTAKLKILPSPIANFNINDPVQCLDSNNFVFTNNSSINTGLLNYQWTIEGSIFTDTNLSHSFNQYDTFKIKLLATSYLGCKDSIEKEVYVYPLPVAAFIYLNNCVEDTVYFYDRSAVDDPDFMNKWLWDFGNNNRSYQQNAQYIYYDTGSFKVVLTSTTDFGCSDSALEYVKIDNHVSENEIIRATVENDESILIEWTKPEIGRPKTYILERSLNGLLFNNLLDLDNKNLSYLDRLVSVHLESYTYRVYVTDSCNYQSPYSNTGKTILLTLEEAEDINFLNWTKYEEWTEGIEKYEVQLNDLTTNQFTTIATVDENILAFTDSNQDQSGYCYRIVANSKANPEIISISNEVCTKTPLNLWVPNSFTPNNDGTNDFFEIRGTFIEKYQISIYNRWGERVFESNDIKNSWDGSFKGVESPQENYYYQIFVKGTKAQYKSVKGMVLLIR